MKGRVDIIQVLDDRIMKPIKIAIKKGERRLRKSNRGGKFDQSILYACVEIYRNETLLYN
jgi:hypothetical protein